MLRLAVLALAFHGSLGRSASHLKARSDSSLGLKMVSNVPGTRNINKLDVGQSTDSISLVNIHNNLVRTPRICSAASTTDVCISV